MAISMDLRVLARKLEKSSDNLLVNASTKGPEAFEKVATAVAAASTLLEGVADEMDQNAEFSITAQQLDEIAALASAFDESGDPLLRKQASVLDELLLSIAAPKNAALHARKVKDDEINRLREERRSGRREEAYEDTRKAHADMNNAKEQAKAVEQQVKRYRPLEAPLQTRYPPDRPGGQMTRITDHVYQDIVTGIIYDYKAGYKTQKGNEVPGSSVENQTRMLGDARNQGASLFETRDSLMSRYASDGDLHHLKKYAMADEISTALKAVRDLNPKLLDKAIDLAREDGLSQSEVGDILSDVSSAEEGVSLFAPTERSSVHVSRPLTEEESQSEYEKAMNLLPALAAAGWAELIADQLISMKHSGVHPKHLSDLERKFLGGTRHSMAPAPDEQDRKEMMPHSLTMVAPNLPSFGAKSRHGLVALALGAIQELAPHLLKGAVAKAKVAGLTDQQIKSTLTADFYTKFKTASFGNDAEVQAAQALFPHLRALGWDDLVDEHLRVMSRLGVSQKSLQKLAQKNSSFDELKTILKQAVFDDVVEEAPATIQEPMIFDDEVESETVVWKPKAAPQTALPKEETAPQSLLSGMFGTFDDTVPEEPKGPVTPSDDLAEWNKTYQAVRSKVSSDTAVVERVNALRSNGKKEEAVAFVKQMINEEMNSQGFAGAFEKDDSGVDYLDVAQKLGAPSKPTEPMVKEQPKDKARVPTTGEGRRFNWKAYQVNNEVDLSNDKINSLESKTVELYNNISKAYHSVFAKFKFEGSKVPEAYERLPVEVKQRLTPMFLRGDTSQAVYKALQDIIQEQIDNDPTIAESYVSKLEAQKDDLYSEFETLMKSERKPDKKRAEVLMTKIEKIERELDPKNAEQLERAANREAIEKLSLTGKELMDARKALRSPENQGMANELKRDALSQANRAAVNEALRQEGLPPMFENVQPISAKEFTKKLEALGQTETALKEQRARATRTRGKKMSILVHPIPTNEAGEQLTTLWEQPERYIDALLMAQEAVPVPAKPRRADFSDTQSFKQAKSAWQQEMRKVEAQWDEILESEGLVGPTRKLFGSGGDWQGTSLSMLKGLKLDEIATPFPNFNGRKNLFENPDEYAQHYLEGQDKFGGQYEYTDHIREFDEIHGGIPNINVKPQIINTIRKVMDGGGKVYEAKVELMGQIPEGVVEKIWKMIEASGKKIRGKIFGEFSRGKSVEEVQSSLFKDYPDAHIPPGVLRSVKAQIDKVNAHNKQVTEAWNKWSAKQGFWPPKIPMVGKVTADDLLKGNRGGRNPDPDAWGATPMAELKV